MMVMIKILILFSNIMEIFGTEIQKYIMKKILIKLIIKHLEKYIDIILRKKII